MKNDLGFVEQFLDNCNWFYQTSLNQFEVMKKLQGLKIKIERVKSSSEYKKVFGSIYTSTFIDDGDKLDPFYHTVLINRNQLMRLYHKSIDQIDFYDNQDILKMGDVLSYSRGDQEYKFKVIDVMTFGEQEHLLYRYTLTGIVEINT